ncbi:MAG: hypothetical protein AAGB93_13760 [Planctomycetota bacterium]
MSTDASAAGPPPVWVQRLLWIDGLSGVTVGVAVLVLAVPLARWYGLPHGVVVMIGTANVGYGAFSTSLAASARRRMGLLKLLVAANLAWCFVASALLVRFGGDATWLGCGHIAGEGVFVAVLGALEWRWRSALVGRGEISGGR